MCKIRQAENFKLNSMCSYREDPRLIVDIILMIGLKLFKHLFVNYSNKAAVYHFQKISIKCYF